MYGKCIDKLAFSCYSFYTAYGVPRTIGAPQQIQPGKDLQTMKYTAPACKRIAAEAVNILLASSTPTPPCGRDEDIGEWDF